MVTKTRVYTKMGKRIIITFSLLFCFSSLFGQIVFNKLYDSTPGDGPTMRNIIIMSDSNYVMLGGSSINNSLKIHIIAVNDTGGFLWQKFYGNDTLHTYHGAENSLQKTPTGNYILGGGQVLGEYRDNMLIKFNSDFDTLLTQIYYPIDSQVVDVITYGSAIDRDGNYLLVGITNVDNNYNLLSTYRMQLIKTDTMGNLLWRKLYGTSSYDFFGKKVLLSYDGGYLLAGWSSHNNGDWCLIKIDSAGNNPVIKYYGSTQWEDGWIMDLKTTHDSCYLITGAVAVDYQNYDDIRKGRIIKIDKNLSYMYINHTYGTADAVTGNICTVELGNGHFRTIINDVNSLGFAIGTLNELNSSGDVLWTQTPYGFDSVSTDYYPTNLKLTPDGGSIFTGYVCSFSLSPTYQQSWLVKTDSMGCDGTSYTCNDTTTGILNLPLEASCGLLVYPNPATTQLEVKLPEVKSTFQKKTIQVTDKTTFERLTLPQKLSYQVHHPEEKRWTENDKKELQQIGRQLAFSIPKAALDGKINIFGIAPELRMAYAQMNRQISTKRISAENNQPGNLTESIIIYDIFGREVLVSQIKTQEKTITVNISSLSPGLYLLRARSETVKFIKQ